MFCPKCRTEYRQGIERCADCGVDLMASLPPEPATGYVAYEEILATFNAGDIAIIKSILDAEKITYYFRGEHLVLRPMADAARLMVKKEEAEAARELLQDLNLAYSETNL